MIDAGGIFDIPLDEYHRDPCLPLSASCSVLELIDQRSPLHAMWSHPKLRPGKVDEHKTKFDIGSAFHAIMTGKGAELVALDVPDFRTKSAREQRDKVRGQGKTPLRMEDYETVMRMKEEAELQLASHEGGYINTLAEYEKSIIWREGTFWFRCRPDVLDLTSDTMWDFKTTGISVAPAAFERHLFRSLYDFRAAYYARGYQALTGRPLKEYRFIPVEVDPPHALAMFALTPDAMELASRRVDRAIEIWKQCLDKNDWPGYPNKVISVHAPAWMIADQEEIEASEATNG